MNRRIFLWSTGLAASVSAAPQNAPVRQELVESATPAEKPAIVLSQVGFLPKCGKTVIYRLSPGEAVPEQFTLRDVGGPPQPFSLSRALTKAPGEPSKSLRESTALFRRYSNTLP